MTTLEIEKTFLAKSLPANLQLLQHKEIIDMYFPVDKSRTALRLRKNGNSYELTKKMPMHDDVSQQIEQTIALTEFEFQQFVKLSGRKIRKVRYYYSHNSVTAEIDIFQDKLLGLVLIDFEFNTSVEAKKFEMPNFCLSDVTNEDFIAGHNLAGKSYNDIKEQLKTLEYKEVYL